MGKVTKTQVFKPGDYVFAKVKGHPPWPAKITGLQGNKYKVEFYGTAETSCLMAKNLLDYFSNKIALTAKKPKRLYYDDALTDIDSEISKIGRISNDQTLNVEIETGVENEPETESVNEPPVEAGTSRQSSEPRPHTPILRNDSDVSRTTLSRKTSPRFSDQGLVSPKSEPRSPITEVYVSIERLSPRRYYKEDASRTPVLKQKRKRSRIMSPSAEEKVFPFTLPFTPTSESIASSSLVMDCSIPIERIAIRNSRTISIEREKLCELSDEYSRISDAERSRRSFLVAELRLLELEYRIKTSLCIESPDPASCTMFLTQLNALEIRPLMLLKNPSIVEVIVKTVHYVGINFDPDLLQRDHVIFSLMAAKVRILAKQCIDKFTRMFQLDENETFLGKFTQLVDRFKLCTSHLTPIEIMQMVHDPFEMPAPNTVQIKPDNLVTIKVEEKDDRDRQRGKSSEKSSTETSSTPIPKSKAIRGTKRRNTRESRGNSK